MKNYPIKIFGLLAITILSILAYNTVKDKKGNIEYFSFGRELKDSKTDELEEALEVQTNAGSFINTLADNLDLGNENSKIELLVIPSSGFNIKLGNASLSGSIGSISDNAMLSINGLTETELPPLDAGMVNVTGDYSLYRMLPHGTHFLKYIDIVLPYNKSLLPIGYSEIDINTYYYDEEYKHWVVLERDSVDIAKGIVVSKVNHFTDFINAIIKVPEMPETQNYTPTTMSGIQAANPLESLNLIQPPSANNNGTVNLSYPIDIPAGRQGMQPNLAITYNSGANEGYLGLGWEISVPSITIETRWGVPRYDSEKESETYLLNGEQLALKDSSGNYKKLSHRDEWINRITGDVQFYPRVEGAFNKIIRHGNSPNNYWWEVIDKNGLRYFYGKKLGEDVFDISSVMCDHDGNIGKWGLTEIRDLYDNFVYYKYNTYRFEDIPVTQKLSLEEITYTGNGTTLGRYKINFIYNSGYMSLHNNARLGFIEENVPFLSDIKVKYSETLIKQYKFCYEQGDFKKVLLKSISEVLPNVLSGSANCSCNSNDGRVVTHIFDYYEAPSEIFGEAVEIETGNDSDVEDLITPFINTTASSLGGISTKGWNIGLASTVGFGLNPTDKNLTAGANYTRAKSTSIGMLAMFDIDGDGLPDKVYRKKTDENLYYRKQLSNNGNYIFSDNEVLLEGLEEGTFSKDISITNDLGVEGHVALSRDRKAIASFNAGFTSTETSVYISDVNGDGLPDIVQNGKVYFNQLVGGVPKFSTLDSDIRNFEECAIGGSEGGVGKGKISQGVGVNPAMFQNDRQVITASMNKYGDIIYDTMYYKAPRDFLPDHGAVRVWIAPYTGYVNITGDACLTEDLMQERIMKNIIDGARVSIQHKGDVLEFAYLNPFADTCFSPNIINRSVQKGDRIYFRLESLERRYYDKLNWSPRISYNLIKYNNEFRHVNDTLRDADGKLIFVFDYAEDFLINPVENYRMPYNGRVRIKENINITQPLSNDVILKIYKNDSFIQERRYFKGSVANNIFSEVLSDVSSGDIIKFEIISRTNINWQSIKWLPVIEYIEIVESGIDIDVSQEMGDMAYRYKGVPHMTCFPKPVYPTRIYNSMLTEEDNKIIVYMNGFSGAGAYVMSIKDETGVVFDTVFFANTGQTEINLGDRILRLLNNRNYYFDLYTKNESATTNITRVYCRYSGKEYDMGLHTIHKEDDFKFGSLYRNWGQFTYYNEDDNSADNTNFAINESLLKTSETLVNIYSSLNQEDNEDFNLNDLNVESYNPSKDNFISMTPDYYNNQWVGFGSICYIRGDTISNTAPPDLSELEELCSASPFINFLSAGGFVSAKNKSSRLNSYTFFAGVTIGGDSDNEGFAGSIGGCHTTGTAVVESDFVDMNGDRFPDSMSELEIQYSQPQGGLSNQTVGHAISYIVSDEDKAFIERTRINSSSANFGGSYSGNMVIHIDSKTKKQISVNSSASASVNPAYSWDSVACAWLDINGDGLPDRVFNNGTAFINMGYKYSLTNVNINNKLRQGMSMSFSGNFAGAVSKVFNKWSSSFSGGLNASLSKSKTRTAYIDINGDGLPDMLTYHFNNRFIVSDDDRIEVKYNYGGYFSDGVTIVSGFNAQIFRTETLSGGINGAFTFGIPLSGVKLSFNPKGGFSWSVNKTLNQFIDMNGDGYVDHVSSDDIGHVKVRYSQIGNTNLLKSVTNIANGKFDIDYALSENSYNCPNRIRTMSSLKVYDGYNGDGIDTMYFTFNYEEPRYDRYEREALGFAAVKTYQKNIQNNYDYRIVSEEFHNKECMRKGLKKYELTTDNNNRKYIEKFYNYALFNIETGNHVANSGFCYGAGFPALQEEVIKYYEGQTNAGITTQKLYEYGPYGNIKKYSNIGDMSDNSDNIYAEITYHPDTYNKYIVGVAKEIKVSQSSSNILRKRETTINDKGKILNLKVYNNNVASEYDYTYNTTYGHVIKLEFPADNTGIRKTYNYSYDTSVFIYVIKTYIAPLNYISESEYDYKFGKQIMSKDINKNIINYEYDWRGRLSKIKAPLETNYTLKFYYWFDQGLNYLPGAQGNKLPWAVTYHYDADNPSNPMTTTLFCDAFGRVVQTKKDIEINGVEVSSVSGQQFYDSYGRVTKIYYPVTESVNSSTQNPNNRPQPILCTLLDNTNPTVYTYDILDRQLSVNLPDNSVTYMSYDFLADQSGIKRFRTKIIDANGKSVNTYKDARGLQTQHTAILNGENINTRFSYNVLGELLSSFDPDGFETSYEYDMLGRLIKRKHPDAGEERYSYDRSGNLISHRKQDGSEIQYKYYVDRLDEIRHSNNPENNVKYIYYYNEAANNIGRVHILNDATGWQRIDYDVFGNVKTHIRSCILPNEDSFYSFTTEYEYDSWNRIKKIVYPDGEVVAYGYNKGGQLKTIKGQKGDVNYNYINDIKYDKFEKKTELLYGNGTKNIYIYDILQRLNKLTTMAQGTNGLSSVQDLVYTYDMVGNITALTDNQSIIGNGMRGSITNSYVYDDLYRLSSSEMKYNTFDQTYGSKTNMQYEKNGRIKQRNEGSYMVPATILLPIFSYSYTYNQQQPNTIRNVQTSPRDSFVVNWDANGNMIKKNTQVMMWDENNRMLGAVANLNLIGYYIYDLGGERTYKLLGTTNRIYNNGVYEYFCELKDPVLYVSPYMVATRHGYTKHIYAGSERIASKIGKGGLRNITYKILPSSNYIATRDKQNQLLNRIIANANTRPVTVVRNQLAILNSLVNAPANNEENDIYYYHNDHLGSSSWITYTDGKPIQYISYTPFGNILVNNKTTTWSAQYTFSGKERDAETGFSYFGARYYDANLGIWLSVDPLSDKYPSLSPYVYCGNNPINMVDPNGMSYDWYKNDQGVTLYNKDIHSAKDMKDLGIKGEYLGKTYQEGSKYYSLFGKEVDLNTNEGKLYQKTDEALINYANWQKAHNKFNVEPPTEQSTNFDIGLPFKKNFLGAGDYNLYLYDYEGATGYYSVYGTPSSMKGKLDWGSKVYQNNKNFGFGNMKPGYNVNIYSTKDPRMKIVTLVFPTLDSRNALYKKWKDEFYPSN